MHIEAVIGANYGDEGKGMFTEHLCRCATDPIVVMSNGGCQRGHTVNNVECGIRHIFNHFCSGTFMHAPTVFSHTYLLNPIMFIKEHDGLAKLGFTPASWRAPSCMLQLPSDMFINQQLEVARAKTNAKHGSCGLGIWETKVRNASYQKLLFEDFAAMDYTSKCKTMNDALEWQLASRANDVDIDESILKIVQSKSFYDHFISDFECMHKLCKLLPSDNLVSELAALGFKSIVVENAQGLLLDKNYAPEDENGRTDVHATPSKCGLEGVLDALGDHSLKNEIVFNYISRSYLTRHGEGPFPEYDPSMSFVDHTNVYNDYQGTIRFGRLDVDALKNRIAIDSKGVEKVNIVATHMNEIDNEELKNAANYLSYEDDSRKIVQNKLAFSS